MNKATNKKEKQIIDELLEEQEENKIKSPIDEIIEEYEKTNGIIYNGIKYNARKKNFKAYVIPSIEFTDEYKKFFDTVVPIELSENIKKKQAEFTKIGIDEGMKIKNRSINKDDLQNLAQTKALEKMDVDYIINMTEYNVLTDKAIKLFLLNENNSKKLCEIMFDNFDTINHNPENKDEYDRYFNFIKGTLLCFFGRDKMNQNIF